MEKIYVLDNESKLLELLIALGYQVVPDDKFVGNISSGKDIFTFMKKPVKSDKKEMIRINSIMINQETRTVMCEDKQVDLTIKEYALLIYLVNHRTRVVTRDELISEVWGNNYNKKSRTLDTHIRTLRQKLGNVVGDCIKTIHRVGFRFIIKEG